MSLSWFRHDATAVLDPKLKLLSRHLDIYEAQAHGHIARLWCWCTLTGRPDGDLHGLDEEAVEVLAGWEGADCAFVRSAIEVGLLCRGDGGGLWLLPLGVGTAADAETEANEPLRQRDLVGVAA